MKILNLINKLKSNKAKTVMLAGLIGLMPSCKNDFNEPDDPEQKHINYALMMDSNMSVDSFMQHVQPVDNLKLRTMGEDDLYFTFLTNGYNVNGIKMFDDPNHTSDAICNPIEFDRVDYIHKDSANFNAKSYWNYWVDLYDQSNTPSDACWEIAGVTDYEYTNKYQGLSDSALAVLARNYLTNKNADPYYTNDVFNAVKSKHGSWSYYPGKQGLGSLYVKSYGQKIGLKCSDVVNIGFKDNDNKHWGNMMFSAMDDSKAIDKNNINSQTVFVGSAYGTVNKQKHDDTEEQRIVIADSAYLTIDAAKNETIVMPFKNWYTVTIIKSGNVITTQLSDLPSDAAYWAMEHAGTQSAIQTSDQILTNGLKSSEGFIIFSSNNEFVSVKDPSVAAAGEITAKDVFSSSGIHSSFSSSYYKSEETAPIATGLEMVYCAPARNKAHSSDDAVATEVIAQGTRNDFNQSAVMANWFGDGNGGEYDIRISDPDFVSNGTHFSFVFGGVRQR